MPQQSFSKLNTNPASISFAFLFIRPFNKSSSREAYSKDNYIPLLNLLNQSTMRSIARYRYLLKALHLI
jgi:hypothetical protein